MNVRQMAELKGPRVVDAAAIGAILLLSAIGYFAGVSPPLQARNAATAGAASVENTLTSIKSLERSTATLRLEIDATYKDVAATGVTLASPAELNAVIGWLTELSAKHKLDLASIEPTAAMVGGRTLRTPIRMNGRGSVWACARFLHEVHKSRPDAEVVGLSLTTVPGAGDTDGSFSFEIAWHSRPTAGK
jgi:Tfp pilus assembly protein PilO